MFDEGRVAAVAAVVSPLLLLLTGGGALGAGTLFVLGSLLPAAVAALLAR